MPKIHSFSSFVNESDPGLTPDQISFIEEHTNSGWKVNPETGLVDLYGDFSIFREDIKVLPVKFGICYGDFEIKLCGLESIEGIPYKSSKTDLRLNSIRSLKGLKSNNYSFNISDNPIYSFIGVDKESYFHTLYAHGSELISLEGLSSPNFNSYNLEENIIPSNFLLKLIHSGYSLESYYKELMEKYSDAVYGVWPDLPEDLKNSIAKNIQTQVSDIDRLARIHSKIF